PRGPGCPGTPCEPLFAPVRARTPATCCLSESWVTGRSQERASGCLLHFSNWEVWTIVWSIDCTKSAYMRTTMPPMTRIIVALAESITSCILFFLWSLASYDSRSFATFDMIIILHAWGTPGAREVSPRGY